MSVATIGGIAVRYMSARLKRTLMTLAGVVLSVALICASGLFGQAMVEKGVETARASYGAFHATISKLSAGQRDSLAANLKVETTGSSVTLRARLGGGAAVVSVVGADAGFLAGVNPPVVAGRLPAARGEIAVERWLGADAGSPPEVGRSLVLDVGAPASPRAVSLLVTGLVEGRMAGQMAGVSVGFVSLEEALALRGLEAPLYDVSFTVRGGLAIPETIAEIGDAVGAPSDDVMRNTALLTAMGIGGRGSMAASMRSVWLILALVILVATVAVISNTFSISVLERFRQFGVLRCVGATPDQLRGLVLREALLLSAASIPLGIGSGILAVRVVTLIFDAISGPRADGVFSGLAVPLSPEVIAGSAAIGLLAVILSALGPCLRAGRVPPLEAVLAPERFVKERARRRRHPVMGALFGIAGTMAAQNITRSRRRFFVSVASITLGVSLFLIFARMLDLVNASTVNKTQDPLAREVLVISRSMAAGQSLDAAALREVSATPGVESVLPSREMTGLLLAAGTPETAPVPIRLVGVGAGGLESLRTHVVEGTFAPANVRGGTGVYLTRSYRVEGRTVRPVELRIGDLVRIGPEEDGGALRTVEVLGFLDAPAYGFLLPADRLEVVTSDELLAVLRGSTAWTRFDVGVADAASAAEVAERLRSGVGRASGVRVEDLAESSATQRELLLELSILLYGLVTVISLIGALNIVNTIGASLILRVRELGMLRAVGTTDGQLRGMVALEGALYGLAAALPGALLGTLVGRLLYVKVRSIQEIPWGVPWSQLLTACGVAIAVGVVSSLVPLRRLGQSTVAESLRGEE